MKEECCVRREFEGGALRDDGCMRVRIGLAIVLRASPCTRRVRLLIGPGLGRWRIDDACAATRLWRARRLGPLGRLAIPCRLPYAKGPRGFELCAHAAPALAARLRPGSYGAARVGFRAAAGRVRCSLLAWEDGQDAGAAAEPSGGLGRAAGRGKMRTRANRRRGEKRRGGRR